MFHLIKKGLMLLLKSNIINHLVTIIKLATFKIFFIQKGEKIEHAEPVTSECEKHLKNIFLCIGALSIRNFYYMPRVSGVCNVRIFSVEKTIVCFFSLNHQNV